MVSAVAWTILRVAFGAVLVKGVLRFRILRQPAHFFALVHVGRRGCHRRGKPCPVNVFQFGLPPASSADLHGCQPETTSELSTTARPWPSRPLLPSRGVDRAALGAGGVHHDAAAIRDAALEENRVAGRQRRQPPAARRRQASRSPGRVLPGGGLGCPWLRIIALVEVHVIRGGPHRAAEQDRGDQAASPLLGMVTPRSAGCRGPRPAACDSG